MFEDKKRFSLGEISPGLCFRVDTEIPNKGLRYLKNGLITSSAGLTNFPALEKIKSIALGGVQGFKVFKYKINKKDSLLNGYLFLYTDKKVLILRMDNFVQVKEIATTYTAYDIQNLSVTQFENSVISCVANKEPIMIRVDESTPDFTVVEYWKNIVNPPVKKIESEYQYSGEDKQVFSWYKSGAKVIFESTIADPIYKEKFINNLKEGTVSVYGGDFKIEKVENATAKQKLTTVQLTAPSGGIEVPASSAAADEKKLNILDLVFSESLFNKGYPAVVTEYKGRVIFGNVAGNPSAIVASRVFDSLNFRQSLEDNDGFTTFITGNELNTVVDFISYKSLIAVTDKGIYSTQLNTALTTKTSEFYDQKLSRPKGLGYWCESDDAIYYVDTSHRIHQIQDVGADSAYKQMEITTYSNHLIDNVEDIYFFKWGKNNIIGIDTGSESRAFSYNYEEEIMCWTRNIKVPGLNEYVNLDDTLYIFNANSTSIDIYKYSETEVESLEFILPETTLTQKVNIDIPEFFKRTNFGNVKVLLYGNYDIKINGISKSMPFNQKNDSLYDEVHFVSFPNVGKKQLHFEQMNKEKIEVLGVFAEIKDFEQGEDE